MSSPPPLGSDAERSLVQARIIKHVPTRVTAGRVFRSKATVRLVTTFNTPAHAPLCRGGVACDSSRHHVINRQPYYLITQSGPLRMGATQGSRVATEIHPSARWLTQFLRNKRNCVEGRLCSQERRSSRTLVPNCDANRLTSCYEPHYTFGSSTARCSRPKAFSHVSCPVGASDPAGNVLAQLY